MLYFTECAETDILSYRKALAVIKLGYNGCESDDVSFICRLPIGWDPPVQFFTVIEEYIVKIKSEAFWIFMTTHSTKRSFFELLKDLENNSNLEVKLIFTLLVVVFTFVILL